MTPTAPLSAKVATSAVPEVSAASVQAPRATAEALFDGERGYAPEAATSPLDENTVADLELFAGGHGLFDLTNKTTTAFGARRLAWLLKHPYAETGEIRRRQEAARVLREDAALKSALDASFAKLGANADSSLWSHFFEDGGEPRVPFLITNICGLFVLGPLAMGVMIALNGHGIHAIGTALSSLGPAIWIFLMMGGDLPRLRGEYLRYKAVFQLARELQAPLENSASPALRELGRAFSAVDDPAHPSGLSALAARFRRMLPVAKALPLDFLYMHSAKTLWAFSRAFKKRRDAVAVVLGALGELDVYRQWAQLMDQKPDALILPELLDQERASLSILGGHHPLLISSAERHSVPNGVELTGSQDHFLVLTGANMGGKSTFLRMIAVLALLAQIGAPVPAKAMALTPLSIMTSIDISDDLKQGRSFFDAETDRILQIVKKAESTSRLLVVMDEILQGTNPEERRVAEEEIISFLGDTGNLFLLATHDRAMTKLASTLPGVRNIHVEETIEDGKMTFSHKVLPGPATTRNAIPILEMKGYPSRIVERAKEKLRLNPPGN